MNIFSIENFGAIPNSDKVQTKAFQDAIDECFRSGGGEVVVPTGRYIIGDIRLRSNMTLHLMEDAVLCGSENLDDYLNIFSDTVEPLPKEQNTKSRWISPGESVKRGLKFKDHLYTAGSMWNYGIIRAVYAQNVSIIGEKGSLIDGMNLFDENGEEYYRGPHGINMHFCKNLTFSGYSIKDTGNWAHLVFQSENVKFSNVTVMGGHDAIHTRSCKNVKILNCRLTTGDDCVAGFDNVGVEVKNCEISSACSAFRFGGRDITIEKCNIYGPCEYQFRGSFAYEEKKSRLKKSKCGRNNTLCFFTYFVSADLPQQAKPGNILIKDCKIKNVDRFMHLNLSGNEPWQVGNPPEDITFENLEAENIKTGIYAYGNGAVPFELNLKNIKYKVEAGFEREPFIKTANFGRINFENVEISGYSGNAFIKIWESGGEIHTDNLKCSIADNEFAVTAEEKFECSPI